MLNWFITLTLKIDRYNCFTTGRYLWSNLVLSAIQVRSSQTWIIWDWALRQPQLWHHNILPYRICSQNTNASDGCFTAQVWLQNVQILHVSISMKSLSPMRDHIDAWNAHTLRTHPFQLDSSKIGKRGPRGRRQCACILLWLSTVQANAKLTNAFF